jgi:predicted nucleic acid-binding protein
LEWVTKLHNQIVALDTAPVIYFIEENPLYLEKISPFFEAIDKGEIKTITSVITLLEVLVHPLRNNNQELAQKYRDILSNTEGLTIVPLTSVIAEEAARIRARYNLSTPDAIQIATAIHMEASFFLTNDQRLLSIPTPKVLVISLL